MKNTALLIFCLGFLLLTATGALLLHSSARGVRPSMRAERPAPDAVSTELEKTRAALRRFEASVPALARTRRIDTARGDTQWFPLLEPAAPAQHGALAALPPVSHGVPPVTPPLARNLSPVPSPPPVLRSALPATPVSRSVSSAALALRGASPAAPVSQNASPTPPPEEVRDPSVSFIFLAPDFRRAVIDGHLVREGERLPGGDRLVAIHDTSVIVHKDGRRRRIEIPAVFPEPPARAPWVQSTPVIGRQHAEELAPLPRPMTSLPEEVSKRSRF